MILRKEHQFTRVSPTRTGQGIKACFIGYNIDQISMNKLKQMGVKTPQFAFVGSEPEIIIPYNDDELSWHELETAGNFKHLRPDAQVDLFFLTLSNQEQVLEYIKTHDYNFVSCSISDIDLMARVNTMFMEDECIHLCSAGNWGAGQISNLTQSPYFTSVGACKLNDNYTIELQPYSSYTTAFEKVDLVGLDGWKSYVSDRILYGTSFSILSSDLAISDFHEDYYENFGKYPELKLSIEFLHRNAHDMFPDEGYEYKVGYGLVRAPRKYRYKRCETQNQRSYIEVKEISNGNVKELPNYNLDVPVQVVDGRTLVPARGIAEALDIQVDYDQSNNEGVFVVLK